MTTDPQYDPEVLFSEMPALPEDLHAVIPECIQQLVSPLLDLAEVMEFVSDMPFFLLGT